ncbi:MAG: kelch repeat-containing protein [Candidatus Acidiferrales bacterium]
MASATLLPDGTVLVTGGQANDSVLSSSEVYNPTSGTFTSTASLNVARFGQTATLLNNGKVLVAGGSDGTGATASAELYEPGN